ncbi:MAG: porin family protein [Psychrobacter sp.]|uniref:Porin family protein n=1 Tax=Psychrobacter glacincola TaxID=56810 RepID=A0ABW1W544_9GAMM|nr:porin family protein [Psychrobacter glacincola]MBP6495912.1 porin family protein [Psychrobacter sp.]|tara:strand:- start:6351 stop:6938 length:588 start_codon:yes stop_codon:yes gene_type:complete
MKMLQTTVLALATASLLSVSAQAAVNYAGQPYIGAKVGQYSPDIDDADDIDDATSYGVYGGYKFTPEFGVEAEYLTTSDTDVFEDAVEKAEYSADVLGLYATYDYAFPTTALYAKGRLGFAKNEVNVDVTNKISSSLNESFSESDTGVAGGLGLGYNFTPMVSAEAMYNFYPSIDLGDGDDFDASGVTLGAHFKF